MKVFFTLLLGLSLVYPPLTAQINTQVIPGRINFNNNNTTLGLLEWDGTHVGLYNVSGKTGSLIFGSDNALIFRSGGSNEYMRLLANGRLAIGDNTSKGRVGIFHQTSTSSPHLELKEAQTGAFARLEFNNNNAPNYWQMMARSDTDPFFNLVYNDGSGPEDMLRINGSDRQVTIGPSHFANPNAKLIVNNNDGGNDTNLGITYDIYTRPAPSIWTRYGLYTLVSGSAEGVDISTQGQKFGLSAQARSSGRAKAGVYAYAGGGSGTNFGVQAIASGEDGGESYGLYAQAFDGNSTSTPPVWAGYFAGDVFTTGSYLPSDQKLKSGIRKAESSLDRLRQLPVRSYRYQTKYQQKMGLDKRTQTGFLAHELAEIFPELTRPVAQPLHTAEELAAGQKEAFLRFTGVNYVGLIPHLTQAMQEQQQQIERQEVKLNRQQKQIDELVASNEALLERLARLEAGQNTNIPAAQHPKSPMPMNGSVLEQNAPNPFSKTTSIKYSIPKQVQTAQLQIIDDQGRLLKTIPIAERGPGKLELRKNTLKAGHYIYRLILDGQLQASRQMILTK